MKNKFDISSGNVFEDLGLPDSEELLVKAKLLSQICDLIRQKRLTQAQIAKLLGIDQPKISALLRGRLSGFSTDRLLRFLNALHCDIEIHVRRPIRRSTLSRKKIRRGRTAVILE